MTIQTVLAISLFCNIFFGFFLFRFANAIGKIDRIRVALRHNGKVVFDSSFGQIIASLTRTFQADQKPHFVLLTLFGIDFAETIISADGQLPVVSIPPVSTFQG